MWDKIKSWFSLASAWDMAGVVATFISFACIMSYFGGVTANWGIITFAIAGFWAWQRFASKIQTTADIIGSALWYFGVFAVALLTAYTFGANTLLGMYEDWSIYQGSLWGFIRVFAPILTLVIASIMISLVAPTPRSFSKKFVVACNILAVFGLLLYGLVESLDRWMAARKLELAQEFDLDRFKIDKSLGLVAEITDRKVKIYRKIKGGYFQRFRYQINTNIQLPLVDDLSKALNDGPHKMIQVYLPDQNGQFTQYSSKVWVRLDEVNIKNKPLQLNGFTDQPLEDGKVHDITFHTDEIVRVLDNFRIGQKIIISGAPEGELKWPNKSNMAQLLNVPQGTMLTNQEQTSLLLKYKNGGKITIKFIN